MNKLPILFLLSFLLMIGLGSAQVQTLGGVNGFAPGTEINLTQTCTNCTYVNITYIVLGSGGLQNISTQMGKDGTFYNYTLSSEFTDYIGEYIVNWVADPDGDQTAGNYNFFVRRNATLLTTAESFLYIALAIFSLIAVMFFSYNALTIPYIDERNEVGTLTRLISPKYLKILSTWIAYGTFIWFLGIITGISNNFLSLGFARTAVTNLYVFLSIIGYGLTFFILVLLFIEVWKDMFIPIIKRFFKAYGKRKRKQ